MNQYGYIAQDLSAILDQTGKPIMTITRWNETAQVGKQNVLQIWATDPTGQEWLGKGTRGKSIQLLRKGPR